MDSKYTQYAEDVLNGKIVAGEYIKLACRRYLDFLSRDDLFFDAAAADKVVDFIEHLRHYQDKFAGKPFKLEPWQKWVLYAIFGIKRKDGRRLTKKVYITIARKNGKSFFSSAIALYILCTEAGAEVEFAATNAKQANICLTMAKTMAESLDPKHKYLKPYRDKINLKKTNSFMQIISSDSTKNDGWNSLLAIIDELAAHPDSKVYDILASSQAARSEPLILTISTRGYDLYSFAKELEDGYIEILRGIKNDDSVFAAIYSLDEDDEYDNHDVWIKANPNLGVTVSEEFIAERVLTAKNIPSEEVDVRIKTLNQWVNSSSVWISEKYISEATEVIDLDEWKDKGISMYIALDLASVCDLTAFTCLWEYDGYKYYKTFYYLPSETIANGAENYKKWKRQKYLKSTAGNVTDYNVIKDDILRLSQEFSIGAVFYDKWNSTQLIIDLTEAGFYCVPYAQNIGNLSMPTKELARLIYSGQVKIDDNPITRWCFSNVTIYEDSNGNQRPVKEQNAKKIDGVLSMIIALGGYLQETHYTNEIFGIDNK